MPISIYNNHGTPTARWYDRTEYVKGKGSRKVGMKNLGKVIDKERSIFWNVKDGYIYCNPETGEISEPVGEILPGSDAVQDLRLKHEPVIVDLGDSYFLHNLIRGIGYDSVINTISYGNRDSLMAMISFYTLESLATHHAESWYNQNFVKYLYPKADMASQKISEMLESMGEDSIIRDFLKAHLQYVLDSTNDDLSILIDSSEMPNDCSLPVTTISNHKGEVEGGGRLIAIVQRSAGIPLYYEYIGGSAMDITALDRCLFMLKEYGCHVQYALGEEGYLCPGILERFVLSGIDFLSRVSPTHVLFKEAALSHYAELAKNENVVKYQDRLVYVKKIPTVIGTEKESGKEIEGFLYLCEDVQAHESKADPLMDSTEGKEMTTLELLKARERLGLFALVSTRDIPPDLILNEYYVRQSVEQFFDYAKNFAKFLPIREHKEETLKGHLLLSFIASFLCILVQKRLEVVNLPYGAVAPTLIVPDQSGTEEDQGRAEEDRELLEYKDTNGKKAVLLQQADPMPEIFEESPVSVFLELRGVKANVFPSRIIPSVPTQKSRLFLKAFGMACPSEVRRSMDKLTSLNKDQTDMSDIRTLVFAQPPSLSAEEIEQKKEGAPKKRATKAAKKAGLEVKESNPPSETIQVKRGPGRPKGSKNKKTKEQERLAMEPNKPGS